VKEKEEKKIESNYSEMKEAVNQEQPIPQVPKKRRCIVQ